jgi:hypothetical protein
MALIYTWTVTGMTSATVTDLSNAVINVKWICTGTNENGTQSTFPGATPLKTTDIDPATFVPYNQLTETLVLSWVQPIVMGDPNYWNHINERINKQIADKEANVNLNPQLPWATPAPIPPNPNAPST